MFGEMLDTTPEARRFYYERLGRLSVAERLALMDGCTRTMRSVCEAAIRRDHPGITPQELQARVAVRLYSRQLVERFIGRVPETRSEFWG